MRRVLMLVLAGGLLVAACGSDGPDGGAPAATAGTVAETSTGGETGATTGGETSADAPEALRFDATAIDGTPLDVAGAAGRTVAFWFWAPT